MDRSTVLVLCCSCAHHYLLSSVVLESKEISFRWLRGSWHAKNPLIVLRSLLHKLVKIITAEILRIFKMQILLISSLLNRAWYSFVAIDGVRVLRILKSKIFLSSSCICSLFTYAHLEIVFIQRFTHRNLVRLILCLRIEAMHSL